MVRRLLIVEDDRQFAVGLSASLAGQYHIEICNSAREATRLFHTKPYDVILSDYSLAGDNGLDVVKQAKSLASVPRIVMMTAFADKDMAIKALNFGVAHLLEKPFSVKQLRSALADVPERSHSGTEAEAQFFPVTNSVVWKGETIRLTPSEYLIFAYLMAHRNTWVAREEFEKILWDQCPNLSRNVLDTHIYNLRRKVPSLNGQLLAVRGKGFSIKDVE